MEQDTKNMQYEMKEPTAPSLETEQKPTYYGYASMSERLLAHIINSIATGIPYLGLIVLLGHWVYYLVAGKGIGYGALGLVAIDQDTGVTQGGWKLFWRGILKYLVPFIAMTIGFTLLMVGIFMKDMVFVGGGIVLFVVSFLIYGYYLYAIAKSELGQAPYDKATNTVVVREREQNIPAKMIIIVMLGVVLLFSVIIGVFSSVILASLDDSRERAFDAGVVATLGQMQIGMAFEQTKDGTYPAVATMDEISQELLFGASSDQYRDKITWFDNTTDSSQYCAYANVSNSDKGVYYVISEEGAGYRDTPPTSLTDC